MIYYWMCVNIHILRFVLDKIQSGVKINYYGITGFTEWALGDKLFSNH